MLTADVREPTLPAPEPDTTSGSGPAARLRLFQIGSRHLVRVQHAGQELVVAMARQVHGIDRRVSVGVQGAGRREATRGLAQRALDGHRKGVGVGEAEVHVELRTACRVAVLNLTIRLQTPLPPPSSSMALCSMT